MRDGLDDLEHVVVVGDSTPPGDLSLRRAARGRAHRRSRARRPRPPGPHRLHLGHHGRPQGRGAHPPHARLRGAPAGRQPVPPRPAGLVGAPVGHAIGMLGGLLCPLVTASRIYLIDGWDPPTVLDAMVEEQISAGSGSTYFFTSLLDSPEFGPEHVELMQLHRPGWLAHPRRRGRAGGRTRDLAGALLRVHRAPVGHRVGARGPTRQAHPHRRPAAGMGRGAHGGRGRERRGQSASPGRSSAGARTVSPATPTRC